MSEPTPRMIGQELLAMLGGRPGTFAVHFEGLGAERYLVVEVAPGRSVRVDNLPKAFCGIRIEYRRQTVGKPLAG
jgi:hypothetical protein